MKEQVRKPGYRTQIEATEGGNDQGARETWDMLLLSFRVKERKKENTVK
jgi:hypothetical protein